MEIDLLLWDQMFEYNARVVRVIDADTIDVSIDLGFDIFKHQRIRLNGINAAEKNTDFGQEAIKYVRNLLPIGTYIVVHSEKDKTEKYGRYLGRIIFPETKECLNDILITKGYAVPYDGQSPKEDHVPSPAKPLA